MTAETGHFHHVPRVLPMAPRPRAGELRSSWLRRVAAANALPFTELLDALTTILPVPFDDTIRLDCRGPRRLCEALAAWCRLDASIVEVLDLVHLFPTTPADWFVHDPDTPLRVARFQPVLRLRFCLTCLRQQRQRGAPFHLPATWSLAWLTHCPRHQSWFQDACVGCCRSDALDVGAAGYGVLRCRFCGVSFDLPAHTTTLTPVLQLQHTLLACSMMQPPDSSWVGRCGPRAFLQLTHDLLQLVMLRDQYDSAILADYLPERDWDYPRLRLRAHHRFPTWSACERYALLSAVTRTADRQIHPQSAHDGASHAPVAGADALAASYVGGDRAPVAAEHPCAPACRPGRPPFNDSNTPFNDLSARDGLLETH